MKKLRKNYGCTTMIYMSADYRSLQVTTGHYGHYRHYRFREKVTGFADDLLFIKPTNNDLNTFAKEIKLDCSSTYIFSDAGFHDVYVNSGVLGNNARVIFSFVAPASGKRLILRVKHSGEEDPPLEVTLGSTKIQLNPLSKSSPTIDDITLCPIQVSGPPESDHLLFEPEVRNDIFIRFIWPDEYQWHGHFLYDIDLLDDNGLKYMPHLASESLFKLSN